MGEWCQRYEIKISQNTYIRSRGDLEYMHILIPASIGDWMNRTPMFLIDKREIQNFTQKRGLELSNSPGRVTMTNHLHSSLVRTMTYYDSYLLPLKKKLTCFRY